MTIENFIETWDSNSKIFIRELSAFINSYFNKTEKLQHIDIPPLPLILGGKFFDAYEVITSKGDVVFQSENFDEVKAVLYVSHYSASPFKIPALNKEVEDFVKQIDNQIDIFIKKIENELKSNFQMKDYLQIINKIIFKNNIIRY